MRLLKCIQPSTTTTAAEFSITEFHPPKIPSYAILSHRWTEDEVIFQDLQNGKASSRKGYQKLEFLASQAAQDGIEYFWIDTCCINKADSTELSEAINSMFKWYQNAQKCYVYLYDVLEKSQKRTRDGEPLWQLKSPVLSRPRDVSGSAV